GDAGRHGWHGRHARASVAAGPRHDRLPRHGAAGGPRHGGGLHGHGCAVPAAGPHPARGTADALGGAAAARDALRRVRRWVRRWGLAARARGERHGRGHEVPVPANGGRFAQSVQPLRHGQGHQGGRGRRQLRDHLPHLSGRAGRHDGPERQGVERPGGHAPPHLGELPEPAAAVPAGAVPRLGLPFRRLVPARAAGCVATFVVDGRRRRAWRRHGPGEAPPPQQGRAEVHVSLHHWYRERQGVSGGSKDHRLQRHPHEEDRAEHGGQAAPARPGLRLLRG
ncbi:unnamed protein product, partial [Prorocentrum cordatum]